MIREYLYGIVWDIIGYQLIGFRFSWLRVAFIAAAAAAVV
jgi:hypothetical protein